jgi:hypothetical protein
VHDTEVTVPKVSSTKETPAKMTQEWNSKEITKILL